MHELTINEVAEVSGGFKKGVPIFKYVDLALAIGQGIMWLNERSYMGRGEFPPVPRAGRE